MYISVTVFLSYFCDLLKVFCGKRTAYTGKTKRKIIFLLLSHETTFF